jgi:hypothetical protein
MDVDPTRDRTDAGPDCPPTSPNYPIKTATTSIKQTKFWVDVAGTSDHQLHNYPCPYPERTLSSGSGPEFHTNEAEGREPRLMTE